MEYAIYLHIPFCTHRCAYCDFNTYAGQEALIPAYVDALCKEIEYVGVRAERSASSAVEAPLQVHTIFFGGGTPSLLSPNQFGAILDAIRASFSLTEAAEITIEANPGTVSYGRLLELHRLGINRISFGVQSANTEELRMLERAHSFFDVIEAVVSARKAGFENLNLDLIYGLPEQSLKTWQTTVHRILALHPEHISAYALTLEHGTPFGRWAKKGLLPLPDPDLAADMYEWASETFESSGYAQYEISNWAKSGHECKHNLQYWRGLPYLAFGAGAHGYANGYRYSNVLQIKSYIERLTTDHFPLNTGFPLTPATINHHRQTLHDDMSDFMITGLRLTHEGVSEDEFQTRFGRSLRDVYGEEIEELLKLELLEEYRFPSPTGRLRHSLAPCPAVRGTRAGVRRHARFAKQIEVSAPQGGAPEGRGEVVKLTKRGRLLGNQVFMRFVG